MRMITPYEDENWEGFLERFGEELRKEFLAGNEDPKDFANQFIFEAKGDYELTWEDVATILNSALIQDKSPNAYRMAYRNYGSEAIHECEDECCECCCEEVEELPLSELDEKLIEMKKLKVKMTDERTQANAYIRRVTREETIKEIAADVANKFNLKMMLPTFGTVDETTSDREGILLLSDWHYGIDIDNHWNTYNPDIARRRVTQLFEEVRKIVIENKINTITVVNLGDLISGRIHNAIRLQNRIDVITQTIEVSEILAQFLTKLSEYVFIEYYDTSDNHSRIEPNLGDSLDMESLTRILTEFLKLRLEHNDRITINDNYYADDMVNFMVAGHNCVGVHGHHDKPQKVIANLSMLTKEAYDLVVTAHYHHFNADEENQTLRIGNGSLMGTDDYAVNLRLNSDPSQTFIVATEANVAYSVHKINLK